MSASRAPEEAAEDGRRFPPFARAPLRTLRNGARAAKSREKRHSNSMKVTTKTIALLFALFSLLAPCCHALPSLARNAAPPALPYHLDAVSRQCTTDADCNSDQVCHSFLEDLHHAEVYETRCVATEPWKKAWLYCLSARVQDTWPYYVFGQTDYVHCEEKKVMHCPAGTKIVQRNGHPFCKEFWP